MIYLEGSSALSEAAHTALLDRLHAISDCITDVRAKYVYFVGLSAPLSDNQCSVLVSLLRNSFGDVTQPDLRQGRSIVVAPHFKKPTQWSCDVTRLAHDCGLKNVTRIERATVYWLVSNKTLDDSTNKCINNVLCDQLEQTVLPDVAFAKVLFSDAETIETIQIKDSPAETEAKGLWKAEWIINGEHRPKTLDHIVRGYYKAHHYDLLWQKTNWSIIAGIEAPYWFVDPHHVYQQRQLDVHHSLHISQFNWQTKYRPFDAFCVARGHRLHSVMSGYITSDLLVPNFIQPWECRAAEISSVSLDKLLTTIQRRADYWFQLGMPLLGGFLRTLPVAEQYAVSAYGGFVRPDSLMLDTDSVTKLYRIDSTSPRAIARLFSSCVDLGKDNPIVETEARQNMTYCYVLEDQYQLFEKIAHNAGCELQCFDDQHAIASSLANDIADIQLRVSELSSHQHESLDVADIEIAEVVPRILALPAVAAKSFIINHTDQSSGGLVVQGAVVGPWQLPLSNISVLANAFSGRSGVVKACGEKATLASLDEMAMIRMAIGEAITNISAAHLSAESVVKLALSWYLGGRPKDAALYEIIQYVTHEFAPTVGLQIVANDIDCDVEQPDSDRPLELTVICHANMRDINEYSPPRLKRYDGETSLVLIDLGGGKNRMGGSALSQVMSLSKSVVPDVAIETLSQFQKLMYALYEQEFVIAYHDRSDGGLFVTLCEMAFASRMGLNIYLDALDADPVSNLFNEELGVVLQVRNDDVDAVLNLIEDANLAGAVIGEPMQGDNIDISFEDQIVFSHSRQALLAQWLDFSKHVDLQQGNQTLVTEAYSNAVDADNIGLTSRLTFDQNEDVLVECATLAKPKVAILRHPDSQDTRALAAAFSNSGFEAHDVTMHDIEHGETNLQDYSGLAISGGASYNDVLSAGKGWAEVILLQPRLKAKFSNFFTDTSKFVLGIGNGAQLLAHLRDIIPGASLWPDMAINQSHRLESRTCLVKCLDSKSIFLQGMAGSHFPAVLSCKQGRAVFAVESTQDQLCQQQECALQYVDSLGEPSQAYPQNPTGSMGAVAGFCNDDGRITGLMVHPERCFKSMQLSWHPGEWETYTPWVRVFQNARLWLARS